MLRDSARPDVILDPAVEGIRGNAHGFADVDSRDRAALDQPVRAGSGQSQAIGDLVDPKQELEGFIKLADGDSEAILAYARKWGPLWLCRHGEYWQHNQLECRPRPLGDDVWYTRWERLDYWRQLIMEARSTLRIAHSLNAGQLGDSQDWTQIPGRYEHMDAMFIAWDELQWISDESASLHEARMADDTFGQLEAVAVHLYKQERAGPRLLSPEHAWRWETEPGGATLDIHERLLSMVLDRWVQRAGVRPSVFRAQRGRSIRLGGYGLLGALAVQLIFEVCRTDGLVICTSCGTPYLPPKRRPRRDQNPYCPDCGLAAAPEMPRRGTARPRSTSRHAAADWLAGARPQRKPTPATHNQATPTGRPVDPPELWASLRELRDLPD